jgi:phosphoglycolate phosphatase
MLPKIELFIFDLDGTLIDSTRDIANAVNHTLAHLGEPVLPEAVISDNVGEGVLELLRGCLVENHRKRVDEAVAVFRSYYGAHLLESTRLMPGVREALDHFAGRPMAVLTNKPERYVGPILEGLGVAAHFGVAIGGDGHVVPKPAAAPVHEILSRYRAERSRTVMVGDSPVDVETGRLGGVLTCAFTGGFRLREELEAAAPDFMIDRMEQLKDLFR